MQFDLSEDRRMLADMLRRLLAQDAGLERRNAAAYVAPYHAPGDWQTLAELGVLGAFLPVAQGGFGGTAGDIAVVFEEVGRGLCPEPLLGALLSLPLLARFGQDDLVRQIIAGEARSALAFAEPGLTCDLSVTETRAEVAGDQWRLTGRKCAIYGAPGVRLLLVTARTAKGLGLFLIKDPKMIEAGMVDGAGIADLILQATPAVCLCDDAGPTVEGALDLGRIALCAEAVGAMDRLVEMTVDYMKQRRQFGKPVAAFQALRHRASDMVMELEQARSIVIRAVASHGTAEQARCVAMAKNLIGRIAPKISEDAIQLHGGIGLTWEYPGAHYAKRLVMIDHQLGDRYDQALRLIAMRRAGELTEADEALVEREVVDA
ncbi:MULTISPECIES: acyl-CoA dehydrogenase family protein [Marinovum]|uniref:acyl-CoA dehydrogenase family protein n=1 Tax=Marinovum TaxID=367771 RepID=UPI00237B47DC|nr:acyl-CoA dehydrogenase [Marinovum sp. PR37]MDD9746429.1 acyl-CoA dehydrogenase [Marinovum sp. PR37]